MLPCLGALGTGFRTRLYGIQNNRDLGALGFCLCALPVHIFGNAGYNLWHRYNQYCHESNKWLNKSWRGRSWILFYLRPLAILTSAGTGNISIWTPPCLHGMQQSQMLATAWTSLIILQTLIYEGLCQGKRICWCVYIGKAIQNSIKYILQANQYYAMLLSYEKHVS